MKLSVLINGVNPCQVIPGRMENGDDPEITGICYRSDHVSPGFIFVAVKGTTKDGHDFIDDAVSRGAAAIVVEKTVESTAVVIQVTDTRRALAVMADIFYGSPSTRLTLVGITGTNGKTTTACLLEHLLKENGFKTGVIGTIDCHFNDVILPSALTTPEATDIQAKLAMMADAGVTHVIMEVSSHGIVQKRILGCRFANGCFYEFNPGSS
jgi:UDP-N-acetylmuramyl tripeptide synthase